ncbi:hypothetical protein ARMGADRAFT_732185 [Armillaria gallica]|uniref:Uncharacterized protein n=1 Tax=Armillaria gallica TaxID=47427 RepID=A0A2H3CKX1_ARMGA|nr:hypothetical protein ARMGADRAFT_732185 [Armillaria gallica]
MYGSWFDYWYWSGSSSVRVLDSCFSFNVLTIRSRFFPKEGYTIALNTHGADSLQAFSDEINTAGEIASSFNLIG